MRTRKSGFTLVELPAVSRGKRAAFTLVELLVVVGIIAVLVSILLSALSSARKHANAVICLSNLKQLGLGITTYATRHNGAIIPTAIWGDGAMDPVTPFPIKDTWAMLLVTGGLVPDPHLTATSDTAAASTVLVCPEIRNVCVDTNVPGLAVNTGGSDGFDRRLSHVVKPGLIVDYGYGINGVNFALPPSPTGVPSNSADYSLPSTAISYHPNTKCVPSKKMGAIKGSSQMVILYDGFSWNPAAAPRRITGQRHGRPQTNRVFDSGTTNLLFLDGHAEAADRSDLPSTGDHVRGTVDQMRSKKYWWNIKHIR